MKKKYVEPQMIVEDFTVSEIAASNCKLSTNQITFVKQMNVDGFGHPCCNGAEKYFTDDTTGVRGAAYDDLCNIFAGDYDMDGDTITEIGGDDMTFTPAFKEFAASNSHVSASSCNTDGTGFSFNNVAGFECTADTSLLQNS